MKQAATKTSQRFRKAKHGETNEQRGADLDHVLVGGNASGFEGLGGDLLLLVTQHVHALGERVHIALLLAAIVDTKLGVGDTTAITRLDVRLVLLVAKAPSWTTAHLERSANNERLLVCARGCCFEGVSAPWAKDARRARPRVNPTTCMRSRRQHLRRRVRECCCRGGSSSSSSSSSSSERLA
jgi:hypothetical protein